MNFDLKVGFSIVDLLDMVIYNKCIFEYWGCCLLVNKFIFCVGFGYNMYDSFFGFIEIYVCLFCIR